MSETRNLHYRADELVWHALQTGDLSVTTELRKINDRLEVIHRKRIEVSEEVLEVPARGA